MLWQFWKQDDEQSLAVNCDSSNASEEIPTKFLSTPQAFTHWSVSMYPAILSTTTSDVVHWYSTPPSAAFSVSNKHRFPEEAIEKEHRSFCNSSHTISAVKSRLRILKKYYNM